jgi:uncharacterized membrane protein
MKRQHQLLGRKEYIMANGTVAEKSQSAEPRQDEHQSRQSATGGETPPGWTYNPSAWPQRLPIIALALVNCALACYLAACEMGFVQPAWDPFFGSGTARVLNSSISRSFPVPDAALGAAVYLLEALSCLFGDTRRWRTKPWLVLTFGVLVAPLFVVSLVLLMLQPVVVRAWCTFCLLIAAGMLVMVPLAFDEVLAAIQFLLRSVREGRPFWKTLWHGGELDSDDEEKPQTAAPTGPFQGFTVPWNLAVCVALGIWMLIAPVVLQTKGEAETSCYITGALIIAIGMLACAEPARPVRLLGVLCGLWLLIFAPWSLTVTSPSTRLNEVAVGLVVVLCSALRGRIKERYGGWDRYLV